jgi:hypothetical protein
VRARRWAAVLAAAVLLPLAGCTARDVPAELTAAVAEVRTATEAGDYAAASGLLDDLRDRVQGLVDRGELSEAQAGRIMTAAWDLNRELAELSEGLPAAPVDAVEQRPRASARSSEDDEAPPPSPASQPRTEPEAEPLPAASPAPPPAPLPSPSPTSSPPPLPAANPAPEPSPTPKPEPAADDDADTAAESPGETEVRPPGHARRDAQGLNRGVSR